MPVSSNQADAQDSMPRGAGTRIGGKQRRQSWKTRSPVFLITYIGFAEIGIPLISHSIKESDRRSDEALFIALSNGQASVARVITRQAVQSPGMLDTQFDIPASDPLKSGAADPNRR